MKKKMPEQNKNRLFDEINVSGYILIISTD